MMTKYLLCAAFFLALGGCKKELTELDRLPDATQEGRTTAGWLLDGKAQVPAQSTITNGIKDVINGYWRRTRGGRSLSISFRQFSKEEDWGVAFFLPDIRQPGTFVLNQVPAITNGRNNAGYGQYYRSNPDPDRNCYTGPEAPGQLVVTRFDTVQNIVSGTFEMTPRQDGGTATFTITQGRFDLRFER